MSTSIRTRLVKIGNSQGVRIPRALIFELGLNRDDLEMIVEEDHLLIRPVGHPRAGWDAAFRDMAEHGDDQLLDDATAGTTWDAAEWQW